MKKNTNKIILSIVIACCLMVIPFTEVLGSEIDGGQVSVPGKISFDTGTESTKELTDTQEKKANEKDNKKFFSALPKTGENKTLLTIAIGVSFIILSFGVYLKRKLVIRNEIK